MKSNPGSSRFQTDDLPITPVSTRTIEQDVRIARIMNPERFGTRRVASSPAQPAQPQAELQVPTFTDMLVRNIPQKIMTARSLLGAGDTAGGKREMDAINVWVTENMESLKSITRYHGSDITKLTAAQWAGRLIEGTDFNELIPYFDPRNNPNSATFIARKNGFGPAMTSALQMSLHGDDEEKRAFGTALINANRGVAESGVKGKLPASVMSSALSDPDAFAGYATKAYEGTLRGLEIAPGDSIAIAQRTFQLGDRDTGGEIMAIVKDSTAQAKEKGDTRPPQAIANSALSSLESFAKIVNDNGDDPGATIVAMKNTAGRVIGGNVSDIMANRGALENTATRYMTEAMKDRSVGIDLDRDTLMGVSYAKSVGRSASDVFGAGSDEARLEGIMAKRDAYVNAITATQPVEQVTARDGRVVQVPQNSDLSAFADTVRSVVAREFNRMASNPQATDANTFAGVEAGLADLIKSRMPASFSSAHIAEAASFISNMLQESVAKGESVDIRNIADRADAILTAATKGVINGERGTVAQNLAGSTVLDTVEASAPAGSLASVLARTAKNRDAANALNVIQAGPGDLTALRSTLEQNLRGLSVLEGPGFADLATKSVAGLTIKDAKEIAPYVSALTSETPDQKLTALPSFTKLKESVKSTLTSSDSGFSSLSPATLEKVAVSVAFSVAQTVGDQLANGSIFGPDTAGISLRRDAVRPSVSVRSDVPSAGLGLYPAMTNAKSLASIVAKDITSDETVANFATNKRGSFEQFRNRVADMLTPVATKALTGSETPVAIQPPVQAGYFVIRSGDDLTRKQAGAQVVKALVTSLSKSTDAANYDRLVESLNRDASGSRMDPASIVRLSSIVREAQARGEPFNKAAVEVSTQFAKALKARYQRELEAQTGRLDLQNEMRLKYKSMSEDGL